MTIKSEWRVRPVTRYILTHWVSSGEPNIEPGSCVFGEFENVFAANQIANALADQERTLCPGWEVTATPIELELERKPLSEE